jgi:hypothetical protein
VGALTSFFGLIGTIIRRRAFVSLYAKMLLFHLGFHLVTGGINLYLTLRNSKAGEVQNCIDKTDNATHTDANITKDVCEKAVTFARALSVVPFVITCLLELYACIIASNYAKQLEEEGDAKASKYALGQMEPLHPYGGGHYAFTGSNAAIASHA